MEMCMKVFGRKTEDIYKGNFKDDNREGDG